MTDAWTSKYDNFDRDFILQEWNDLKAKLEFLKEQELEMRKYVVSRAFPKAEEGTNTLELGNGYQLKAQVKFNYNLKDNDTVRNTLHRIRFIGNNGPFIADHIVKIEYSFLLTEFRKLESDAEDGSEEAKAILKECHSMLNIVPAAPTLSIKEPKIKK